MDILVAYNVRTDSREGRRRLRRVAQICLNYGQRVQHSVFECRVDEKSYIFLQKAIQQVAKPTEDSVRIYRINTVGKWVWGLDHYVEFDDPLIY
jgi:CRISPR-associated protein Cas2